MDAPRLNIELVPRTVWRSNVRSNISPQEWETVKRATFAKAALQCEICSGRGVRWPVECHEVWEYQDKNHRQVLIRTQALCPDCHHVKHIGLAEKKGEGHIALRHLSVVNGWTIDEAREYRDKVFRIWHKRSQYQWALDLSWIYQNFAFKV